MAGEQLENIWNDVQASLAKVVPANVYRIWLEHLKPVALDDRSLYVEAPDQTIDWLRRRFGDTINKAAQAVDPLLRGVELLAPGTRPGGGSSSSAPTPAGSASLDGDQPRSMRRVNPVNTFEQFVIGEGTQFAHAAALAVAEMPASAYNPLFLHGAAGTGKTHLLQAVANYLAAHEPQFRVRYLTAEAFATGFRSAVRGGDIASFKSLHRSCDVLLVDDVRFLESKKRSTEEFLYTVDDLVQSGAQVVLSADRTPAAMDFLGHRLQARLEAGLVATLEAPNLATRLAVLRKRAPDLAADPDHDAVLTYLATSLKSNVRVLEAALIRVHAYASLTRKPITIELAQHVLSNLQALDAGGGSTPSATPSIELIQRQTSQLLQLDPAELASAKRNRQVVYARQVAMYLCRELTPLSLPDISSQFGGRDHTTVLHAHRKIRHKLLTEPDTRTLVERLSRELRHATTQ